MRALRLAGTIGLALALWGCGPRERAAQPASGAPSSGGALSGAQSAAPADPCAGLARALCANKDILALGAKVQAAMAQAGASISPQGLRVMAANEKSWLDATRLQCGVAQGAAALTAQQAACLKAAFATRAQEALHAIEKKGPFTFQRVEINQIEKVSASPAVRLMGADAPKSLQHAIQFPRIDGDSAIAQKFNDAVRQTRRFKPADQTEETTTYQLGYVGPDLISVRFDRRDLTIGAARPNASASAVNFNMRTGARVTARDVFRPGAKWQDFLAARAAAALAQQVQAEDETARPIEAGDIRDAASDPNAWYITDKALVLLFPAGALAPSSLESAEVSIPWKDLKPYLNPQGPGPIKAV